jgi:hypothetical protein
MALGFCPNMENPGEYPPVIPVEVFNEGEVTEKPWGGLLGLIPYCRAYP